MLDFLKLDLNKRSDVMQIFDLRYPEKKIRYFTIYLFPKPRIGLVVKE